VSLLRVPAIYQILDDLRALPGALRRAAARRAGVIAAAAPAADAEPERLHGAPDGARGA
jgi:hypothetical protein